MKNVLGSHRAIAWDYDDTLIGNSSSTLFQDWIRAHPEQEHYIITFRNKADAELIPAELRRLGFSHEYFRDIFYTEDKFWNEYFELPESLRKLDSFNNLKRARPLKYHNLTNSAINNIKYTVGSWKPRIAQSLGCTLLVDDLVDLIQPHCAEFGVTFVDSWNPYD